MKTYTFHDYYNNVVNLTFAKSPFSDSPGHVWVLCRYGSQWLLTLHPRRGFEFPGGKVEKGETAEEAAVREVWEETGGVVSRIWQIGQYRVHGKAEVIVKSIFFAEIEKLVKKNDYMETKGPLLMDSLPADYRENTSYSFIMKDEVLPRSLEFLKEQRYL